MLDLICDGRVEFGTGRSSTRAEIEGFDIDPHETREMWDEALEHIVGAGRTRSTSSTASTGRCAPRRVHPKPLQKPHPPIWGATRSLDGHHEIGRHGIGLCSFTVGVPPEELDERIANYREGLAECKKPVGQVRQRPRRDVHDGALRRHQREGRRRRRGVVRLVPEDRGAPHRVARGVDGEAGKDLGNYSYAERSAQARQATASFDHLDDRLPLRQRRGGGRRPGPVHRDRQALRGRPAASCCSAS